MVFPARRTPLNQRTVRLDHDSSILLRQNDLISMQSYYRIVVLNDSIVADSRVASRVSTRPLLVGHHVPHAVHVTDGNQ